jgi:hypothetical protein
MYKYYGFGTDVLKFWTQRGRKKRKNDSLMNGIPEEGETVGEERIVFLKSVVHQNHIGRQLLQQRTLCNT